VLPVTPLTLLAIVPCQKRVCKELLECDALHRVALQQAAQQAPAGGGQPGCNVLGQACFTCVDVAQQLDVVGAVVWGLAHQKLV
jgi:hypothetical protein